MSSGITKIIIVIVIIVNIVLITITSISVNSAIKRQLATESETSVTTESSLPTIVKQIFNSNNFIAIIKTIEGVNLIIFGILIIVKAKNY